MSCGICEAINAAIYAKAKAVEDALLSLARPDGTKPAQPTEQQS